MKRNGAPFLWNGCAVLAEYAVTVENGETVIYKEEAINQLLEKEFTDAINALAEE